MTTDIPTNELDKTYTVLSQLSDKEWNDLGKEFSRETLTICREAPMSKIALQGVNPLPGKLTA